MFARKLDLYILIRWTQLAYSVEEHRVGFDGLITIMQTISGLRIQTMLQEKNVLVFKMPPKQTSLQPVENNKFRKPKNKQMPMNI